MKTAELITSHTIQFRNRQRFESRKRFLYRCIEDIEYDFHKQYGPFQEEWDAALDACYLFLEQLDDYLCSRDFISYECQHIFGALAVSETKYQTAKQKKRCEKILITWKISDTKTLKEIDEHISSIRSVYKMIAVRE